MRTAGPIPVGAHMQSLLRLCRAMSTFDTAARRMQLDGTPQGPPVLATRAVAAAEEELGVELPDDVLVVMTSRIPALQCALGLSLERVLEANELVSDHAHLPDGWIGIAVRYHEPFAERDDGAHGGPYDHLCIRVDAPRAQRTELGIYREGEFAISLIDEACAEMIAARYRSEPTWLEIHRVARSIELDPSWVPALEGELAAAAPPVTRRVRHATFGEGTVMRELDGGKLEIAFDTAGKKVLLARFVQPV